jgi:pimeloyl-ACP methyl ester carboxylesterase
MRDYPELVRSAVLDSVVPLEANMFNDATDRANFALETLFDGCAADAACAAAYPNLRENFYEALAQFDEEPIEIEVNNPDGGEPITLSVGDSSLLNSMMWALHTPSYVSQTPRIIDDIYRGDYGLLSLIKDLPFASLGNMNIGLRLSVECHEQIFPTTIEELETDINQYPALVDYGYSYIFGSIDLLFTACGMWGAAPHDPADKEPLQSDIPTLILAGQYDPTTPAYYGRQLAQNLPNSYLYELPGHGHAPSVGQSDNCGLAIALIFLANPSSSPDHACLEEQKQLTFFVPYDGLDIIVLEPLTNLEHNLSGLVPSGWETIGGGGYNRNYYLNDPTQIVYQASMVSAVEWVDFLEEFYQNVGLDSTPEEAGIYEINGRSWQLYTAEAANNSVDIALLELPDGWTWLVMMTSDTAERDAFYEQLFLPAVEALEWLGV